MAWIPFNLNDRVRVRLTDRGRLHHRQVHERLMGGIPGWTYTPPEETPDGWSEWQLWVLMSEFGSGVFMGGARLMETGILFEVKELPDAEEKDRG